MNALRVLCWMGFHRPRRIEELCAMADALCAAMHVPLGSWIWQRSGVCAVCGATLWWENTSDVDVEEAA